MNPEDLDTEVREYEKYYPILVKYENGEVRFGIWDMTEELNPRLLPTTFDISDLRAGSQKENFVPEDWAGLIIFAMNPNVLSSALSEGYIAETNWECGLHGKFIGNELCETEELDIGEEPDWAAPYSWFKDCLSYTDSLAAGMKELASDPEEKEERKGPGQQIDEELKNLLVQGADLLSEVFSDMSESLKSLSKSLQDK